MWFDRYVPSRLAHTACCLAVMLAGCALELSGLGPIVDAGRVTDSGARLDAGPIDGSVLDAASPVDARTGDDAAFSDTAVADAGFDPCVDGPLSDSFRLCPFSTPRLIGALSSPATDDDPTLTADLLEFYFNSFRAGGRGGGDIWVSRRGSPSDGWATPVLVTELSTPSGETTPEVSADGLTMWISSNRPGSTVGDYDIWTSRRADRSSGWSTPVLVPGLSTPERDVAATLSRDGLEATVSMSPPGGGDWDLARATRSTITAGWGPVMRVTELYTARAELDGYFDRTGLHLFFDHDLGVGWARDIVFSTRADRTSAFDLPTPIPALNGPEGEEDPWLSDDTRYVVFASARSGVLELYEASR